MYIAGDKVQVMVGYEEWHKKANGQPPAILKDGQIIEITELQPTGMYKCRAGSKDVFILEEFIRPAQTRQS